MHDDRNMYAGRLGRRSVLPLLLVLAASLPLAGAVQAGNGTNIIRGVQHEFGSCGAGDGYQMTGDLVGCWWVDTFETKSDPDKSTFVARGWEHFEGCMGDVCGAFVTRYEYSAKTVGPWPSFLEIHGRCHHPIVRGTGGFAGASGEISFHDVVDVSPPYYPYIGNVHLAKS